MLFLQGQRPTVTAQVRPDGGLVLSRNGEKQTVVPRSAAKAWVLKDGKTVLYSFREMKQGYEGEGEALFLYDPASKKKIQLLSAHYIIDKVFELTTAGGKTLLCVTMSDGGLGANHIALVNPERGTVFANPMSRFEKVEPNRIVVAEWGDSRHWVGGDHPQGRPTRYITFIPDRVLTQRAVRDRPWR
jgi:hypothetical protein